MMTCQRIVTTATAFMMTFTLALSPSTAMGAKDLNQVRVAVFDFELIDTSLQGEIRGADESEAARLARLGKQLRDYLATAPGVVLADIGPVRGAAKDRKLHGCNGCAAKLAVEIGADLAVTGTVQKVSNLILNINVYVEDVTTGTVVLRASADIRGNTDESWRRGLLWLIRNRLVNFAQATSEAMGSDGD